MKEKALMGFDATAEKLADKRTDKLFMIMDNELIPMSEEEIRSVFDDLRLSSEDDRRNLGFDEFDSADQARIEIQVLAHTGTQVGQPDLLNA